MIKKILLSGLITGSLLCCVSAESLTLSVGGQLGYGKSNTNIHSVSKADIKNSNAYYGLNVNAYVIPLGPNLELGGSAGVIYSNNLSKIVYNGNTEEVSNLIIPVMASLKYNISLGFSVFGDLGVSYGNISAKHSGTSSPKIKWDNSWNATSNVGVSFKMPVLPLSFYVQWMHVFGKSDVHISNVNPTGSASKVDLVGAGVSLVF